jgi:hypothetical protein
MKKKRNAGTENQVENAAQAIICTWKESEHKQQTNCITKN